MNRRRKKVRLLCAAAAALALVVWIAWGNKALTVTQITVTGENVPQGFFGFRIAQVSDLHNASFGEENQELLQVLSDSGPDIIVLTGDLVDAGHTDMDVALAFAERAADIAPVYYVTGNHEAAIEQIEELLSELKRAGVTVLEDEALQLERNGDQITLAGLSDPDFVIRGDLFGEAPAMVRSRLEELIGEKGQYTILLSHRPELFDVYAACGIDLVLAGHAHGGQFRLPFVGGLVAPNQGLFPKYDAGLFTEGATNMVVSRGLGNSILPFRVNNRPEVVLVELGK